MTKYEEWVKWTNKILTEFGKSTLRFIFYRIVSYNGIPNTKSMYNRLSDVTARARESGEINWELIIDEERVIKGRVPYFDYAVNWSKYWIDDLFESASKYEINKLYFQKNWIEVWCEKKTMNQQLAGPIVSKGVLYVPSHGYSSVTFLKKAADRMIKIDKPKTILYLGDFDGSGLDIERDIQEKLVSYGVKRIVFKRICLTKDQIIKYNIPPKMAKSKDKRTKGFVAKYGNETAELDALHYQEILKLIDIEIKNLLDVNIEKKRIEWEQAEREFLKTDIPRRLKIKLKRI